MTDQTDKEDCASDTGQQSDKVSVTYEVILFSDGTTIQLDANDVVVFVGPNNAGKSAALKELELHLRTHRGKVVTTATIRRAGDVDALRAYALANGQRSGDPTDFHYRGFGYDFTERHITHAWQNDLGPLRGLFCTRIKTETRITDSNPQEAKVDSIEKCAMRRLKADTVED